jgi:hypothetical protein
MFGDARLSRIPGGARMKTRFSFLLMLLWTALSPALLSEAHAAPLNLVQTYPDFTLSSGQAFSFVYDNINGGGTLTISSTNGIASYTEDPDVPALINMTVAGSGPGNPGTETFMLTATLDQFGNVTSGSFKLDSRVWNNLLAGDLRYDGNANLSGLLSGDLDLFGFSLATAQNGTVHGILEFTFDNASGVIATDTPLSPFGGGGMIWTLQSSTMVDTDSLLTANWTGSGFGDVFVPVPAAVWLFGSGLLALLGAARRKRNNKNP